jgi:hypothetical protein
VVARWWRRGASRPWWWSRWRTGAGRRRERAGRRWWRAGHERWTRHRRRHRHPPARRTHRDRRRWPGQRRPGRARRRRTRRTTRQSRPLCTLLLILSKLMTFPHCPRRAAAATRSRPSRPKPPPQSHASPRAHHLLPFCRARVRPDGWASRATSAVGRGRHPQVGYCRRWRTGKGEGRSSAPHVLGRAWEWVGARRPGAGNGGGGGGSMCCLGGSERREEKKGRDERRETRRALVRRVGSLSPGLRFVNSSSPFSVFPTAHAGRRGGPAKSVLPALAHREE